MMYAFVDKHDLTKTTSHPNMIVMEELNIIENPDDFDCTLMSAGPGI